MKKIAMVNKPNVLIVDDDGNNLYYLRTIFNQLDVNVIFAKSGQDALAKIKFLEIALALLDIMMPEMNGIELAREIQHDKSREMIPIIFITALEKKETDLQECYDAGAVDFILKPINRSILLSKVNIFLELYRQKQQIKAQTVELELKANEYKEINLSLKNHLVYENTLSKISGMAVSVVDIDDFLEASITLLGEANDVSRVYIFKHNPETDTIDNTHEWCNKGVSSQKVSLQGLPGNLILFWTKTLTSGEILNFSDIENIPDEGIKNLLRPQNILSVLVVPVFIETSYYGFIGFDNCFKHKEWTAQDVSFLQAITRIIASAIERKQVENTIREREAKFRFIFESANVGKSITLPTGRLSVNKAFCDMLGYLPEELRNKSWQEITPAEDIQLVQKKLTLLLKGEKDSDRFEKRYIHKNGSVVWTDLSVVLQRDATGSPLHFITTLVDITERKLVEEKIRKLSQAVEQSPASVVITDLNGDIEYVNPKFVKVTGYSVEEVIGENPRILKSGTQSHETYKKLWKTITSGNEWQGEFENVKKNGEHFWESVAISPVRNSDGAITHFLAIKEDITIRKNTERALYQSEAKLRRITNNISDVVFTSDLDLNLTYITPSIEKLTGHKPDFYINLPAKDRIPPKSLLTLKSALKQELQKEGNPIIDKSRTEIIEAQLYHANRSIIDVSMHNSIIRDDNGIPIGIQGAIRDNTKLKQAEETLKMSEQKYRSMINASPDGIFLISLKLIISEVSEIGLELLEINNRSELIGKSYFRLIPQEEKELFRNMISRTLEEGLAQNFEIKICTINQKIFISETSISLIQNTDGKPLAFLVTIRDISERKKQEQKQIHASRMASLGEMATGIAHEINQPLNIISIAMDNLVLEADTSDSINREYLLKKTDRIFENIDRMKNIIDHVRSFSRNQDDFILTGFKVNESIRNALSMISEQLKYRGISLEINLDATLPQIIGNTFKFEQVILNLLSNARDTLLEKMEIVRNDFEMLIHIKSYKNDDYLIVEVSDNGMGISSEDADRVMIPFYSTKEVGKGTGLGLSISYQIIKEMGGRIEIDSKINEGTTFKIVLNVNSKNYVDE